MKLLLPAILALAGGGAGLAAGHFLQPDELGAAHEATGDAAHPVSDDHQGDVSDHGEADAAQPGHASAHDGAGSDFVKLNNQFIVPVLKGGRVTSMVVLSLTLEATAGQKDEIYASEPRVRDALLQVLFDYANAGGFDGTFTSAPALDHLRVALREEAQRTLGDSVLDVLVTEIARQDS